MAAQASTARPDGIHQPLYRQARRVLIFQLVVAVVAGLGFLLAMDWLAGIAAVAGTGVSLASTLILRSKVTRASKLSLENPKASMLVLYVGAVQRFIVVVVLFAVAIALLELNPIALFTGFVLGQLGFLVNARGKSH